ncbi:conjugal transfer protein TraN [Fastidiosibacter lacustris]|uniref:conjugal transfer protein TraN n=1 Tax=Fastidiosibacter lacustris TaxID=2056695 RepID=UPI000E356F39|nr:conjugal transfer protein TraN [Fastidiosibacter lacustris]
MRGIHYTMWCAVTWLFCITTIAVVTANEMQQHFDNYSTDYQDVAKNMITSGQLNSKINAQDYTKDDINAIAVKGYYDNPDAMTEDSKKAYRENTNTQALSDLQINGKQKIDPNNPAYKKAAETQANADKILHETIGSGYQCTEVSMGCTTETTVKTCQQSNHQNLSCYLLPKIEVIDVPYLTQDTFTGQLANIAGAVGYIVVPEKGTIISAHIQLNNYGHNIWTCKRNYWGLVSGDRTNTFWPDCGGGTDGFGAGFSVGHISIPVASQQSVPFELKCDPGRLGIRHCGTVGSAWRQWTIVMNVTRYKKEAHVTWQDTCTNLQTSACVKTSEVCTEGGGTRHISGIDVTLDCWRYDLTYSCGYNKVDSCKPFADKCNYVSQRCIEQDSGFCLTYEKTYHCIQEDCAHKELRCGDPNSILFTQKIAHGTANGFGKAVAGFAGVSAAGNDLNKTQDQLQIFKGKPNDCGEAGLGLYDCCDGGGNMLHRCSETEKALKEARDKNLATYVGRYCAKKALGVCLVYHQSWCMFESKLTRIIQEQGRAGQLRLSFGDGENPNCSGLTPEQLQQINFEQIDFSEIYADLSVHSPSDQSIEEAMSNKFKTNKETPQYMKKKTEEAQDQPLKDEDIKYQGV